MAVTNVQKNSSTVTKVPKGRTGLTWDEATFTWNQANNSTWDGIGAIVTGNINKSSVTKTAVTKSTI